MTQSDSLKQLKIDRGEKVLGSSGEFGNSLEILFHEGKEREDQKGGKDLWRAEANYNKQGEKKGKGMEMSNSSSSQGTERKGKDSRVDGDDWGIFGGDNCRGSHSARDA